MNFHQHNPRRTNIIHFRSILDITCHCHEFLLLGTHFPLAKRGILDLPTVPGGYIVIPTLNQHLPLFPMNQTNPKNIFPSKNHPTQNSRKSQKLPTHWCYRGPLKSWDQKKKATKLSLPEAVKKSLDQLPQGLKLHLGKNIHAVPVRTNDNPGSEKNTKAKVSKISFQ